MPLGQKQEPQSPLQLSQFSLPLQVASPHEGQEPQSLLQLLQSSPLSQLPSEHEGQEPQSLLQLLQSSPLSQLPLGQTGGQSCRQILLSSPLSQVPLPHAVLVARTAYTTPSSTPVNRAQRWSPTLQPPGLPRAIQQMLLPSRQPLLPVCVPAKPMSESNPWNMPKPR